TLEIDDNQNVKSITAAEKKALLFANITLLMLILILILIAVPKTSFLRNPQTGSLINGSPLMDSVVVIIPILFFVPSVVYGRISKAFHSQKDVAEQMGISMSSMGGYIALVFVCAQFVDYFNYSNIGTIIAIKGADFLRATGLDGWAIMLLFILLTAFINLLMGSSSAKWAIMAPVFIPMFMAVGYSPELVQVAYRIGDSTTNIISPLLAYFAMIVVFAKKYDKDAGVGTIISTMVPYSIFFLIGWAILLVVWMLLGLPLGPGAPIYI
ncbi:MAG: AbgT family transporter, partial [Oscillospiraceae bacterium]